MKTAGQILKSKREERKKKISSLAAELKIREEYLVSLEEDRYQAIAGGPAIIQGLIRSYAEILGLDGEKLVAVFRRDFIPASSSPELIPKRIETTKKSWLTTERIGAILGMICILVIVFFVSRQLFFRFNAPKIILDSPREGEKINGYRVALQGRIEGGDVVTIEGQPLTLAPDGSFWQERECLAGENVILLEAANPRGRKSQLERRFYCGN
ncbi:helix-turn-helix domain-containing protein [Candidatus Shapirobacteria bacterium]|nr:helix-turn-helix domain-containing protein [Candidatus Shapirobacteria bacterium]